MNEPLMVDPEALAAHGEAVARASKAIQEHINSLQSATSALRSEWTGEAQRAFTGSVRSTFTHLTELAAQLNQTAKQIGELAPKYSAADVKAALSLIRG